MKPQIFAYLFFTLTACGQTKDNPKNVLFNPKVDTTQKQTKNMSDYSPTFENAHLKAKALMAEKFFFDPTDETGPFGNDDGADTYAGFKDWRKTNKTNNPKIFLYEQIKYWDYPLFDLYETDLEKLKPYLKQSDLSTRFMSGIDAAISAIAFGQIYLEGTVDKDFIKLAKTTIKRELIPELLNLWGDDYKKDRETKLTKMLGVLNQVE